LTGREGVGLGLAGMLSKTGQIGSDGVLTVTVLKIAEVSIYWR
jgi:hypothetical protein